MDESEFKQYLHKDRRALVKAKKYLAPFSLELSSGGRLSGRAGDWMIMEGDRRYIVKEADFAAEFVDVQVTPIPTIKPKKQKINK